MDHEDGDGDGDGDGAGLDGGVDGDSRGGMKKTSGGDSGGVSPLRSSPRQPSVFYFVVLCFSTASLRNSSGAIFIVGFRSRLSHGRKDRWQRSHEDPEGGPHVAKEFGRVGHPLLGLRPPLVCFLRSQVFFLHKTDARKFSVHLDVVWVPETQNYRK